MLAGLFMIEVWSAEGDRRLSLIADEIVIMKVVPTGRRPDRPPSHPDRPIERSSP